MKKERILLILANLLLMGCLVFFTSGCTTFEKAQRKYATSQIDTTFVTVRQTVPHDSAILHIVTDTTTITREIRQGRARIIYQRNAKTTTVRADCDTVILEKKVPQYITRMVWGVDPEWKKKAIEWEETARTLRKVSTLLFSLIILGIIAYLFTHQYKLSVAKR